LVLKEVIERESQGRIQIQVLGGQEVIPPPQQFDAVRNGVVDILVAAPYYQGTVPEIYALIFSHQNGVEMRASGIHNAMVKAHAEKAGVHYLGLSSGQPGKAYRIYLKKAVDSADLSGLKIRVSPATAAAVEALGAEPVSIPFTDTYTALERGTVDGFAATYTGIMQPGLHEVTGYILDRPFYSLNAAVVMNQKAWDALPAETKAELERILPIYEAETEADNNELSAAEDKALAAAGMKFITLSSEAAAKFDETVEKVGWQALMKADPDGGPALMEMSSR
jgi:TRAP-type C4-dicarboxylate transport system substrate-binding protein